MGELVALPNREEDGMVKCANPEDHEWLLISRHTLYETRRGERIEGGSTTATYRCERCGVSRTRAERV